MKILLIGLGKMGHNLALNLMDHDWDVVGYDQSAEQRQRASQAGISVVEHPDAFLRQDGKKAVWLMVPAGDAVESIVKEMLLKLKKGDILIEAGNSYYRDSMRRAEQAQASGIAYLDVGTSGGLSGARSGLCFMIGGDQAAYADMKPVFTSISVPDGCLYTGESGSGHFLKMIHNGVEYGMMQAIGEGFQILEESEFDYRLEDVAGVWNHGSVVRSWLMELAQQAFSENPHLESIAGIVHASGEAKWTAETALELEVAAPIITLSLMMRNLSKDENKFSAKVVAALRNGFGGHAIVEKEKQ